MPKHPILLIVLMAIILTACAAPPIPAATATPLPTATAAAVETAVAQSTSGPATCKLASSLPARDPAEAARFAPVTDKDWIQGPSDAKITLLEYSDFM